MRTSLAPVARWRTAINECQLDLFADRTAPATMRANRASCATIRLRPSKIGALASVSVRRIKLAMNSACPFQREWALTCARLSAAAARSAPSTPPVNSDDPSPDSSHRSPPRKALPETHPPTHIVADRSMPEYWGK